MILFPTSSIKRGHKPAAKYSSAESLLSLINDILDFSKVESGKLELENISFDLLELIGDLSKTLSKQAYDKGIAFIVDVPSISQSHIISDPGRIRQVLTNLLSNAIKFTSTTRQYGGSDLGLTISRDLCQLMHGDIRVTSELGQGSVFTASFMVDRSDKHRPIIPRLKTETLSVLVLSNEQASSSAIEKQLQKWGVRALTSSDINEAVNILKEHVVSESTKVTLVYVDAELPNDGALPFADVLQKRSIFQGLKLVLLTKYGSEVNNEFCQIHGFSQL